MDINSCSGTYSTMASFCAEHNYNYRTMRSWKAEYLSSSTNIGVAKLQMPTVHHSKSAQVLNEYLVKSKAVGRSRCEVFDDGPSGRGVRARIFINAMDQACYYSRNITTSLYGPDKVYQYSDSKL